MCATKISHNYLGIKTAYDGSNGESDESDQTNKLKRQLHPGLVSIEATDLEDKEEPRGRAT